MAVNRFRTSSDPVNTHAHRREVAMWAYLDAVSKVNRIVSPFLRLPTELRLKIYEYVFAVPLIRTGDRNLVQPRWRYSKLQLSILGVCRDIYWEARILPFSVNVFRGWSGKVDRTIITYMKKWQAYSITNICLYIDKMDVFRNPHLDLRSWFVLELRFLCKLPQLKQLTLMWHDHQFEYVGQAIFNLVWKVLGKAERRDIALEALNCDPCKAHVEGPDRYDLVWNYELPCTEPLELS